MGESILRDRRNSVSKEKRRKEKRKEFILFFFFLLFSKSKGNQVNIPEPGQGYICGNTIEP